jgi:hypothetical protein
MATLIFGNNANTTLASPIGSSDTTCTLVSATNFPVPTGDEYFVMSFFDAITGLITEIVHVTALSGVTATIVRAQEGTAALSWNAGDIVESAWTAGQAAQMAQIGQIQDQTTNSANDSGTVNAYVADLSPAPTARVPGMPIRILNILNTNTGPSTLNVGLGASPIYGPDGSALIGGELLAGSDAEFIDHSTYYQLSPVLATTTRAGTVFVPPSVLDSGSANAVIITVPQYFANLSAMVGQRFNVIKSASANTGSVTMTVNGISAPLVRSNYTNFAAGDLPATTLLSVVCTLTLAGPEFVVGSVTGTAGYKAASDPTKTTVASVSGSTTTGHFLIAADIAGTVADGGVKGTAAAKAASNNADGTLASVTGAVTIGHYATFADTNGSVQDGGAPIISKSWGSGYATTVALGTSKTFSHSLGAIYAFATIQMKCVTNDGIFSAGDVVVPPMWGHFSTEDRGFAITNITTSNVTVTIGSDPLYVPNGDGVGQSITPANWQYQIALYA